MKTDGVLCQRAIWNTRVCRQKVYLAVLKVWRVMASAWVAPWKLDGWRGAPQKNILQLNLSSISKRFTRAIPKWQSDVVGNAAGNHTIKV